MLVTHHKEKAYNAITFFVNNTSTCNKKKLYKLLYILDFEHFEQTGRSVTGFDYFAWKMGPVPTELHEAIEYEDPELREYFEIENVPMPTGYFDAVCLKNKVEFDEKLFSQRELKLMKSVAERFYDSSGKDLEDFTHRKGSPWFRVWEEEQNRQKEIPYEYALSHLDDEDKELIVEIAKEREAILANYR